MAYHTATRHKHAGVFTALHLLRCENGGGSGCEEQTDEGRETHCDE